MVIAAVIGSIVAYVVAGTALLLGASWTTALALLLVTGSGIALAIATLTVLAAAAPAAKDEAGDRVLPTA